jgi:N-acetylneuraminic acid mutarotase
MKTKLSILLIAFLWSLSASAQWSSRASFPGIAKSKSTAFTIADKIYMMGGVDNAAGVHKDFWEYDIPSDTWTHKPDFPGPERYGAVSFVINNKGYIATGGNDFGYLDDLWEYNPVTSSWVQKTGLPAGQAQHENQRREAYSFVIGNKAYLGGGDGFVFAPNSTTNIAFSDLWEYDPVTNIWITKANIPAGGKDFSIGVAINNKGYVGLGCNVDQTINQKDFWEYDPVSDTWTAKANFPTNFTVDAGAFVLNSNLYLAGGVNLNPVSLSNQFYKYDPINDSWTLLTAFNGGAIAGAFAVSTGTSAFAGTGYHANITTRNDLWEFTIATGINENILRAENISRVYPNPASDFIAVSMNSSLPGSTYIISDIYGRSVLQGKLTGEKTEIDISALSAGTYILKMGDNNNQITNKFLKK